MASTKEFAFENQISVKAFPLPKRHSKDKSFRYLMQISLAGKATTPAVEIEYTMDGYHLGYVSNGKVTRLSPNDCDKWHQGNRDGKLYRAKPIEPSYEDVLDYILESYRNLENFSSWIEYSENFGMNFDSIHDKSLYEKALSHVYEFRKLLGNQLFCKFRACLTQEQIWEAEKE